MAEMIVDTNALRTYAERLKSINSRIANLDQRINQLYGRIGLLGLWKMMQMESLISERWIILGIYNYLSDTAVEIEMKENSLNQLDPSHFDGYSHFPEFYPKGNRNHTGIPYDPFDRKNLLSLILTCELFESNGDETKNEYPLPDDSDRFDSLPGWIKEWVKEANKRLEKTEDEDTKSTIILSKAKVLKVFDELRDGEYGKALETLGRAFIKAYGKSQGVNGYLITYILNATKYSTEAYMDYWNNPSVPNLLNCFWEASVGGILRTGAEEAYDIVKLIPGISTWYESKGAKDGNDMFNIAYTEWIRSIFGNDSAEYVSNYYADNGGLLKGLYNGFGEIGDEIKQSCKDHGGIVGVWLSGWNSIFN